MSSKEFDWTEFMNLDYSIFGADRRYNVSYIIIQDIMVLHLFTY